MAKRVLVVKTSLRNNSNSDALAEEFARGAREAGNEVEVVEKMHEYELRRTI